MTPSPFKNKIAIVTGHTGFKGSWLAMWLKLLGADVTGVALDPPSQPSHFEVAGLTEALKDHRLDIRDSTALKHLVSQTQPDFVFHLAAQPLVRQSYLDPVETYQTNVLGTLNLLEALRPLEKPCTAVLITSDKCYDNVEWSWGYRESDRLGGSDPYSASKGAAELVIRSYVKSFFPKGGPIRIAVGRAGNVIGGGDWSENRIVPDCVQAWMHGDILKIRSPNATRPWQHVLEPLCGYLKLAQALYERKTGFDEAWNFGPGNNDVYSVQDIVKIMSEFWGDLAKWELDYDFNTEEANYLKLDASKAII